MKKIWIYSLLYKSLQLNKSVLKILGRFGVNLSTIQTPQIQPRSTNV